MLNLLIAFIATLLVGVAKSDTNCHPQTDSCPPDPAVGGVWYENFSQQTSNWTTQNDINDVWNGTGLYYNLTTQGEDFGLNSNKYIMFGHLTMVVSHPVAVGIISKIQLASDTSSSIVFVWQSGVQGSVVTSYSGSSSNTSTLNTALNVNDGTGHFNTYEVDWTASRIIWSVNGQKVREVARSEAPTDGDYPQTPMYVRIELIDGAYWGRGGADWSQAPFILNVQSMQLTDYSTGSSYSYADKSGTQASIRSNGGIINGTASTSNGTTPSAQTSGTPSAPVLGSTTSSTSPSGSAAPSGLSVAAQAGIGVAVGVVGLAALVGGLLFWRSRRRSYRGVSEKSIHNKAGLALDGEPGVAVD